MTRPKGGRPAGRRGGAGKGPGRRSGGGSGGGKIGFVKEAACGLTIPRALARAVLVAAQLLSIEWQIRSTR